MSRMSLTSLKRATAVTAVAVASCGIFACSTMDKNNSGAVADRGIASIDDSIPKDEEFEKNFQTMLNDPMPSVQLKETYIENLLGCLYRAEAYIDQFEKELDPMVAKAEADPSYQADTISTESYKKIHLMHLVSIDLTNRLTYSYGRLLETQADPNVSTELQNKATTALNDIDNTLAQMPTEDRLQLLDLVEGFRNLRQQMKGANNVNTGGRNVASVGNADFANFNYDDQQKLKADLKKTAKITRTKANKALHASYPFIEAQIAGIPASEREPAGVTPYAPSPGPMGNVIGTHFAPGIWALTLDDGPHPSYTPQYMDALLAHRDKINTKGAPASFMWIEANVALYPAIVRRAVESGFSTNCHSWTHMLLNHASHAARVHEVIDAVHAEEKAYGRKMRFYRCPGGNCYAPAIPEVRQMIADLNLLHAYWSLDSLDWKLKDAQRTFVLETKQMTVQRRGVILMHDVHPYSLEAAKMLLNWIGQRNNSGADHIRMVTLDEAVDLYNKSGGVN